MNFPQKLQNKINDRAQGNILRKLPVPNQLIDFSSNDYLGFSTNEDLSQKVLIALKNGKAHNGSTGSRLLSGNHDFHTRLELKLANFFKAESTLLFNSGYDANVGLLSSIPQRGDRVFYDAYSHASIRDGIRLSNAKGFGFKHNDLLDLKSKISSTDSEGEIYVVVEAVYSMDGDMAPLKELVQLAAQLNFKLIVDEAHSTGIFGTKGQGIIVDGNLEENIFARVYTFGKAMGCHGAIVAGNKELIEFLINFARSFIYTTAMPLYSILTIEYAIDLLVDTKERERLSHNINKFKERIDLYNLSNIFIDSISPIQSAVIGSPDKVKAIARNLREHGFDAKPILSPTVPLGQERIRFCIHSHNTSVEIQEILFLLSTFA